MRTLITLALALSTLSLAAQTTKKAEPVKPAPAAAKAEAKPAPKTETKATPAAATFVGNKDSKTYHKADCKMAAKMKAENKQSFATKAEAEKAGFKACKVCKP